MGKLNYLFNFYEDISNPQITHRATAIPKTVEDFKDYIENKNIRYFNHAVMGKIIITSKVEKGNEVSIMIHGNIKYQNKLLKVTLDRLIESNIDEEEMRKNE